LALPGDAAADVAFGIQRRAGLLRGRTRLRHARQRRRQIEVLVQRALHDARQLRIVESGPPLVQRRCGSVGLARVQGFGVRIGVGRGNRGSLVVGADRRASGQRHSGEQDGNRA
jgi:hypothetical protein